MQVRVVSAHDNILCKTTTHLDLFRCLQQMLPCWGPKDPKNRLPVAHQPSSKHPIPSDCR